MDLSHQHPTIIRAVRSCYNDDGKDLVAIAGEHTVDVLLITDSSIKVLASFHVGIAITTIAWSPAATSPTYSSSWSLELAVASAEFGLYLLTKSSVKDEYVFSFGGGLSGHHGRINDMTFCGGRGVDGKRYLATVADDKMLMVWDLLPLGELTSSTHVTESPFSPARAQPTAYPIAFSHALTSVASHATTSKQFVVGDSRGSVFLTDWRSDPQDVNSSLRHSSVIELTEPLELSSTALGLPTKWSGSVDWHKDNSDIIGAVYGPRFCIWDISQLQGGKPTGTGASFTEGAHKFRWCPTYTDYFAISTLSPTKGALIHVHNIHYLQAPPTPFQVALRPHYVQDFDFLLLPGIPRIASAVGSSLIVFSIGVDA